MMHRLYASQPLVARSTYTLSPTMMRHLKAWRLRVGDALCLFDGRGGEYLAEYLGGDQVRLGAQQNIEREWSCELVVGHAVCSTEACEWALQKAVEMGATRYVPILSKHSQPFPKGERQDKRLQRWLGLIQAASEQCGRNRLMQLLSPHGLYEFVRFYHNVVDVQRYCFDVPKASLSHTWMPLEQASVLLIGPEGGWHKEEILSIQGMGFAIHGLGPGILRSETAVVAALARVTAHWRHDPP